MFIAANWKMNLKKSDIKDFLYFLKKNDFSNKIKLCIFPQSIYLSYLIDLLENTSVLVGAQNCYYELSGPFTGEISPECLKDIGCNYVILGHSERRIHFKESSTHVKMCAETALKTSLTPIICVGESYEDRMNNEELNFIENQIYHSIPNIEENFYIAYEPIWSIGTGSIPTNEQIFKMHDHIKKIAFSILKKDIKVLYGGSVSPNNIDEILKVSNVDGVLIGGASLKIKDFLAIYGSVAKHVNNN